MVCWNGQHQTTNRQAYYGPAVACGGCIADSDTNRNGMHSKKLGAMNARINGTCAPFRLSFWMKPDIRLGDGELLDLTGECLRDATRH